MFLIMRFKVNLTILIVFGLMLSQSFAAHTRASLELELDQARPGASVTGAVLLRMDPRWHTYWKNPGDSGMPTEIRWELPQGISAGEIRWPVPRKLSEEELTTYIYTNETALLVEFKLAQDLAPGRYALKAKVSWLECDVQCLPGDAAVEAFLQVGSEDKPASRANRFTTWRAELPQPGDNLQVQASWEANAKTNTRPLLLTWAATANAGADFFPDAFKGFSIDGATEIVRSADGKITLRKIVRKTDGDWPNRISGLIVAQNGGSLQGFAIETPVQESGFAKGSPDQTGAGLKSPPVWQTLLYAFIGGLILNIMPCVLPVIALKILGFVSQSRENPARVRKLGFVYGLGVLCSFLVLAGLVISVRLAGNKAGWGMQFGNPQFLVLLTVLVTLVALNLFGLFEVNIGSRVMGTAGELSSREGAAGAFFNGVLATVLATPCTAPFLGAALGFAFIQEGNALIVVVFVMVAFGLALPYILLSWNPAWLKFVPKPGAWMERFKVAMGFPMLATALWLLSITSLHYGSRVFWLTIFLLVVAMAAWVYGQFFQRARAHRGISLLVTLALLAGGYVFALEKQLQWRSPPKIEARASTHSMAEGIDWQPWSADAVAQARAQGRPVFVDFTADWCLTCQVNKKVAIEVPSVQGRLKEIHAVTLLADYTRRPDEITTELYRHGRAGVPLVLVYPKNPSSPPLVLPEALTPGIVLKALEEAAK